MTDKERLIGIINKFKNQKIAIIGDLMLDKYIWGTVDRVSPEAPVPVVLVNKITFAPGGAANTASNAASLGAKVFVIGTIGTGQYGKVLIEELNNRNLDTTHLITDESRPTIRKTRVVGHGQQLLRIDSEKKDPIDNKKADELIASFEKIVSEVDCVVVPDYAKGLISEKVMRNIIVLASKHSKKVIVDPKQKDSSIYRGAYAMTPNHKEACELMGKDWDNEDKSIIATGKALSEKISTNIILTRGEKGLAIFEKDKEPVRIPAKAREVYDVTGAGDTTIATLALATAAGANLKDASIIATYAASIAVGKVGTSTVTTDEMIKMIENEEE